MIRYVSPSHVGGIHSINALMAEKKIRQLNIYKTGVMRCSSVRRIGTFEQPALFIGQLTSGLSCPEPYLVVQLLADASIEDQISTGIHSCYYKI